MLMIILSALLGIGIFLISVGLGYNNGQMTLLYLVALLVIVICWNIFSKYNKKRKSNNL